MIDVYKQYFGAECEFNGVLRRGASVTLTAESGGGMIRYEVAVSFFPHTSEDDFGITYDAFSSVEIYNSKGRRSKKREKVFLEALRENADAAAEKLGGVILWDKPLNEAEFG